MNKVVLVGNLTRDPELRTTSSGISTVSFTIAVQRRFKNADGSYDADFISCVAWRSTAEFISHYFQKGSRIGVVGNLRSRSYDDKNGQRRYVTEVYVDEAEFVNSKSGGNSGFPGTESQEVPAPEQGKDLFEDELKGFEPLDDPDLPF